MGLLGKILMAVGILIAVYALKMGALEIGSGKPEASGAIAGGDYYPHLIGACLVAVIGVVLSVLAQQKREDKDNLDRLVALSLYKPKRRDLADTVYRDWLKVNYRIGQHPQGGGFVFNGNTYKTLDDAILAAHTLDIRNGR